jgi:hypothetical protein
MLQYTIRIEQYISISLQPVSINVDPEVSPFHPMGSERNLLRCHVEIFASLSLFPSSLLLSGENLERLAKKHYSYIISNQPCWHFLTFTDGTALQ